MDGLQFTFKVLFLQVFFFFAGCLREREILCFLLLNVSEFVFLTSVLFSVCASLRT